MTKDKNINIKFTGDSKELNSEIDKSQNKLERFANFVKNSAITKLATGITPIFKSFEYITSGIKKATEAISECSAAFEKQAEAETLLETSAKNNPYLDDWSVKRLKEYASQLQSISTVGDEELLPFMAQLAAAGRTQSEIQDIMSAALNVSVSGAMSLDSAVKNLNKTFSGLSGELGETVPQIKHLSKEQLKNGEAVKVLAGQYSGMAQNVAGSTGGWKQFKNTLGDLQEMIGEKFSEKKNAAGQILNTFFSKIISGLQAGKKEADEFRAKLNLVAQNNGTDATLSSFQSELDLLKEENKEIQKKQKYLASSNWKEYTGEAVEAQKKELEELKKTYREAGLETQKAEQAWAPYKQVTLFSSDEIKTKYIKYKKEYEAALELQNKYKDEVEKKEKEVSNLEAQYKKEYNSLKTDKELWTAESLKQDEEANNKRIKYLEEQIASTKKLKEEADASATLEAESEKIQKQIDAYNQKIAVMKKEAEVRQTQVSQEDLLNAKIEHYMAVWQESGNWAKTYLQKLKKEIEDDFASLKIEIPEMPELNGLGTQEQITALESYRQLLLNLKVTVDEDTQAWNALENAIKGVDEQLGLLKTTTDGWDAMNMGEKAQYVQQKFTELGSGINTALSTAGEAMQNQTSADVQNLKNQYDRGLLSEEEYYSKKEELEKKGARNLYKVQLAEWGLNLLMTQSQMALAIAKALSSGTPPLSYVEAAIMGVSAASQLAAQIAAKPVPPSFASGGIVPGSSYSGDRVSANVNSGEMILNARQQRELWETANGGRYGSGRPVFNISIENSASDIAGASVVPGADGFTVAIKKIVSDAMANGEMNDSYQTMKANIYGRRITN